MAEVKIENIEELNYGNNDLNIATVQVKLNVREKPEKSSKIIKILNPGEEVVILEEIDNWAKIDSGYCMKEFLK